LIYLPNLLHNPHHWQAPSVTLYESAASTALTTNNIG